MSTRGPIVGRILGGRYRVEAQIGQGGFGAVYRATHLELMRPVAIKTLHATHANTEAMLARFRREARVQATTRHRAIVQLLDFGREPDGLFYMVQEFVDGQTLRTLLGSTGPLPLDRAVHLSVEILDGLAAAHHRGVVHRDLKPANIMLVDGRHGEEVRILDFGLAKLRDAPDNGHDITRTGQVMGTPAFMAPEQIEQGEITPATDIYAVGVLLYLLVTGERPFTGSMRSVLTAHLVRPIPSLPAALHVLDPVVGRAMAKAASERYPTAEAMQSALLEVVSAARSVAGLDREPTSQPAPPALVSPASKPPTLPLPPPVPPPVPPPPRAVYSPTEGSELPDDPADHDTAVTPSAALSFAYAPGAPDPPPDPPHPPADDPPEPPSSSPWRARLVGVSIIGLLTLLGWWADREREPRSDEPEPAAAADAERIVLTIGTPEAPIEGVDAYIEPSPAIPVDSGTDQAVDASRPLTPPSGRQRGQRTVNARRQPSRRGAAPPAETPPETTPPETTPPPKAPRVALRETRARAMRQSFQWSIAKCDCDEAKALLTSDREVISEEELTQWKARYRKRCIVMRDCKDKP